MLILRSVLAAVLLPGMVTVFVPVLHEEPALRRTFGASYEGYLREIPRWVARLGRR
jgi:protein-S-isoprenylcysteine O-methyltransferase Ste14